MIWREKKSSLFVQNGSHFTRHFSLQTTKSENYKNGRGNKLLISTKSLFKKSCQMTAIIHEFHVDLRATFANMKNKKI